MLRGTLSCHVIVVTYNDIMEFTISYLSLMSQRVMLRGILMQIKLIDHVMAPGASQSGVETFQQRNQGNFEQDPGSL